MLGRIGPVELTPPVFFVVSWLWAAVFGDSEAGIRSLSAVCGVATVPVLYLAARDLLNRRAGLIVAWLAAVNPLLVWYSQEARSYSLMILITAISFLFFVRAMQGEKRSILWWGLASAVAMATHYLSAALLAPEALLLLFRSRYTWRQVAVGIAPIVISGLALLPLLANQVGHGDWISDLSLRTRAEGVPQNMATGFYAPFGALPWIVLAGLGAALFVAVRRGTEDERRALWIAGAVGGFGGAVLVAPVLFGGDYVITRNLLGLWVPLGIAAAVALSARRLAWIGPAAVGALAAISIGLVLWMETDTNLQRPEWRQLAEAVPPPQGERYFAALGERGYNARPLQAYLDNAVNVPAKGSVQASELVLARMKRIEDNKAVGLCFWGTICGGSAGGIPFEPPRGFAEVDSGATDRFEWWLYRSPKPATIAVDDRGRFLQSPPAPSG